MSALKVAIIGNGNVGKTLADRLKDSGYSLTVSISRNEFIANGVSTKHQFTGVSSFFREFPELRPDAICLTIPTYDTGEIASGYILEALKEGVHVVTCEKGSLAFHADALLGKNHGAAFLYSAAVGGGTMMLPYLASRDVRNRTTHISAVINGTCNFIFHQTALAGRTLGESCEEAARLGYAEPGSKDPLSLINGELFDVRMKTCVLFNAILARSIFITPRDLGALTLNEASLEELGRNAGHLRLVVQFANTEQTRIAEHMGCQFITSVDGWNIQGGFRDVQKEPELLQWLPGGVGNALHITEGKLGTGGRYTLTGPGAGHEATTSAILNDLKRITDDYSV